MMMVMSDLFDTEKLGNHSVADLRQNRCAPIPKVRGVYQVCAPDGFEPTFLKTSRGGHFKGIDPTMPIADLEKLWVAGTPILYIGKAGGEGIKATLRTRIQTLLRFGSGKRAGHRGGRPLWQVEGAAQFIISWRRLPDEDPPTVESDMIDEFKRRFGKRPFANLKD
jgi:hypothetical protein